MNTRRIAIVTGILYILGTVTGILGAVLTGPFLAETDFLIMAATNSNQLKMGAFFILLMGISLAFIPIILYPVLKQQSGFIARGYFLFRGALETVTYIISATSMFLLAPLGNRMMFESGEHGGYLIVGEILQEVSSLPMTLIVFSIGALMLYYLFYKSKMIPRWLSVWGIIAIILHIIAGLLAVFELDKDFLQISTILNFPIFLQEMVMAIWLIVKGFRKTTWEDLKIGGNEGEE